MRRHISKRPRRSINWKFTGLVFAFAWISVQNAISAEFPIDGVFGDPKNQGCKSYRDEEEGAYVGFNKGGQTGENGEGGCTYRKIEPLPKAAYRLTGTCSSLEGKPTRKSALLVLIDKDQILYDGTRYVRCR